MIKTGNVVKMYGSITELFCSIYDNKFLYISIQDWDGEYIFNIISMQGMRNKFSIQCILIIIVRAI